MISSLSPTIEPKRCRAKVVDHEKFQAIQLIRVGLNSTYHEFSFLFYKMVPPLHHNDCSGFHLHLLDFLFFYLYYSTRMTALLNPIPSRQGRDNFYHRKSISEDTVLLE